MKRTWIWILAIVGAFLVVFRIGLVIFMRVGTASYGMVRGFVTERGYGMMHTPWMLQGRGIMRYGGHRLGLLFVPVILLLVALGVIWFLRNRTTVKAVTPVAASSSTSAPTSTVAQSPVEAVAISATPACPNCAKPVQDYWVACPHCGEKLPPKGE